MIFGFRLTIPDFMGHPFSMEKLTALDFDHPLIKVSKGNPIAFFLIEENDLDIAFDSQVFRHIKLDHENKGGLEYANYSVNKKISYDLIKDHITENTVAWVQQLWTSNDKCHAINLIHHIKDIEFTFPMIEEIHFNILSPTMNFVLSNPSKPYFDINDFSMESVSKRLNIEVKKQNDMINRIYNEMGKEEVKPDLFKGQESLSYGHDDFNDILYSNFSLMFSETFLWPMWLSESQYRTNINNFKKTMLKPALNYEDKVAYVDTHIKDSMKTYASDFDFFIPTTINWCGNFNKDMVGLNIYEDEGAFSVYFAGTDDCERNFSFNDIETGRKSFFDLLGLHDHVITNEFINELQLLSDDNF